MCSMLFIVCLCTLLLRAHAIGGRAVLLSDIAPGNASSDPQFMTQLTPTVLLFAATAPGVGRELFMYNATSRTVALVKDIFPGEAGSDPADLCLFPLTGDIVFAATTAQGRVLWRTDGTSNGTLAIAGVPEPAHMFYSTSQRMLYLASVNRGYTWAMYLKADYQPHVVIAGGEQNYFPNYFCDGEAGDVYFAASTQATGREIWRVQPVAGEDSAAATLLLGAHDFGIAAGSLSGDPAYLTRCDTPANTVLFSGNRQEGRGDEPLWIASGVGFFDTTQAPLDLADSHPSDIFAVPGHACVFTAADSTGVREPYQFRDMQIGCKKLTAAPTSVAHPLGTEPRHFSWWRSRLYFSGNADDGARDMFSLSLDSLPQTPVHALSGARIRDPTGMTVFQDSILFAASTPDAGTELYRYFACDGVAVDPLVEECDGGVGCRSDCMCDAPMYVPTIPRSASCARTYNGRALRVADFAFGPRPSDPELMTPLTSTLLLFAATSPAVGRELFMYNATSRTVALVKDIFPGETSSDPTDLCLFPPTGVVVFAAYSQSGERELWRSDGTESGTVLIPNTTPPRVVNPSALYFSPSQQVLLINTRLSDNFIQPVYMTPEYTFVYIARQSQVADANPLYFCDAAGPSRTNHLVFFAETFATGTGRELASWSLQAGHQGPSDIAAGPLSSDPRYITVCGQYMLFSADRHEGHGTELIFSVPDVDTSPPVVFAVSANMSRSYPSEIYALEGGDCVLTASDGAGMREAYLWRDMPAISITKLNAAPTSLYQPNGTDPKWFRVLHDRLYFSANTDEGPRALFSLPAGQPGSRSASVPERAASGVVDVTETVYFSDSLVFSARTDGADAELYQYFACDGVAVDPLVEECDGGTGCLPNCTCDTPTYQPATPRDRSCVLSPIVQTNPCDSSPCANGASCVTDARSSAFECVCASGFRGSTCDEAIPPAPCASSPCVNGTCVNNGTSFECVCPAGWSGLLCDMAVVVPAACESAPCYNGATCESTGNGTYVCSCAAGYEGTRCEKEVDECASRPCANGGTCVDMINGYLCTCAEGFAGLDCATNIDDCVLHPCENGGSCVDGVGSFVCHCVQGFTGNRCSLPVPAACDSRPCMHGGNCSGTVDTFLCACPAGWNGTRCEQQQLVPPAPVIVETEEANDSWPVWKTMTVALGATGGTLAVAFVVFSYISKLKATIVPAFTPVSTDTPAVEMAPRRDSSDTRLVMDM